jgi:rhodanese-related sulfurtransferase
VPDVGPSSIPQEEFVRFDFHSIRLHSIWILALATTFAAVVAPRSAQAQSTKPAVQKIDVDQFDQKRKEKDAVVLDVRTPREYAEGHVPGAVNLDIHDPQFDQKITSLDKSKTYLVHCAKGVRSAAATRKMSTLGFLNLFDFHGGFTAWENAHKPVEKGSGNASDDRK